MGLPLIFIILTIMGLVNSKRENHVFPLYLKGAAVELNDDSTPALPIDTSLIVFDINSGGTQSFTLADGTVPGQILTMIMEGGSASNDVVVAIASYVFADFVKVKLDLTDESCTLIWNGEAWAPLALGVGELDAS